MQYVIKRGKLLVHNCRDFETTSYELCKGFSSMEQRLSLTGVKSTQLAVRIKPLSQILIIEFSNRFSAKTVVPVSTDNRETPSKMSIA